SQRRCAIRRRRSSPPPTIPMRRRFAQRRAGARATRYATAETIMTQIPVTPNMRVAVHTVILGRLFRSRLPTFLPSREQLVDVRGRTAQRLLVEEVGRRVRDRVCGTVEVG